MRRSAVRRRVKSVLRAAAVAAVAAVAVVLVAAFSFPGRTLGFLDKATTTSESRLGSALAMHHGLVLLARLSDAPARDAISGVTLDGRSAAIVPGTRGVRRFDGKPGENIIAPVPWTKLSRGGVILLRARFPRAGDGSGGDAASMPPQRIVYDHTDNSVFGLRLAGGNLEAIFTDTRGSHCLSVPFTEPSDRFCTIAFRLAPDSAALFANGRKVAEEAVAAPLSMPNHFATLGTDVHEPPVMDVSEWMLWRTPLSDREIARASSFHLPLSFRLEPLHAARAAIAASLRDLALALCAGFDHVRPSVGGPAALSVDVAELDLALSRSDKRYLGLAQRSSLSSGFRVKEAAKFRKARASMGGRTEPIRIALAEPPAGHLAAGNRPAFVVAAKPGFLAPGSGMALLFPPEEWGARHPDAAKPLPLSVSAVVRLNVDGDFRGLYCMEPFDRRTSPWMAVGAHDPARMDHLFSRAASRSAADGAGLSPAQIEEAWRRAVATLRADPRFPWSAAEAAWRATAHEESRKAAGLEPPDPAPIPDAVLGDNIAAFYLVSDLDLAAARFPEGTVFTSDAPDILSPEGKVTRPEGRAPRAVELRASLPDGSTRSRRFRVVPRDPALPALFVHVQEPLDKLGRYDFTAFRIAPGPDGRRENLRGTAERGGGIKLRGNTSFITGAKRSMNIEFDAPVDWIGARTPSRHALLLCGYADPTRLRNALSFDSFRAMEPGAPQRAVPVSWTEVFFNGEWAGVWEICPRMRDVVDEDFACVYKVRSPHGLWTHGGSDMVDRDGPDAPLPGAYDRFAEFNDFVSAASAAEFSAAAPDMIDESEWIDFFLLVNFTGNEDGRVTNQHLGLRASDNRWVALPWDYDKTFMLGRASRERPIISPLFGKLFMDAVRRDLAATKWRSYRAGPLSDAALDAWIDERAALLAPYMDEEWRLLHPLGFNGDFAAAVEAFRTEVHARAAWMDTAVAPPPGKPGLWHVTSR